MSRFPVGMSHLFQNVFGPLRISSRAPHQCYSLALDCITTETLECQVEQKALIYLKSVARLEMPLTLQHYPVVYQCPCLRCLADTWPLMQSNERWINEFSR